jgi:hypothetical protein
VVFCFDKVIIHKEGHFVMLMHSLLRFCAFAKKVKLT